MKKEDFIVGAWYKPINQNDVFGKLKSLKDLTNDYFPCKEYISSTKYDKTGNYFGSFSFNTLVKVELSEIFDYLPDGHPDKIIKTLFAEDLTYLIPILEKHNIK